MWLVVAPVSSAHLNPAVTFAVTATGKLPLWKIPHFLLAQFLGAFAGKSRGLISSLSYFVQRPELSIRFTGPLLRNMNSSITFREENLGLTFRGPCFIAR